MINIPFLTAVAILFVSSVYCYRVPRYDNPDLVIDEELNLVEPKLNLWQVLFRPKSKHNFKNVLKLLNNADSREKYSVNPRAGLLNEPFLLPSIKTSSGMTANGDQYIVQEDEKSSIVSKEITDNQSEENPKKIIIDSVSESESNEKSSNSDSSSSAQSQEKVQSKDNSKQSSSQQSTEVKDSNLKSERIRQLETLRYEADLPKSLHHFEMDKPRFQHSIRDGWTY